MQNILPSIHLLEIFKPVADREDLLVGMLEEVKNIDFYKGIELPVIFQKENIAKVRRIAREKSYQVTEWASPDIIKRGYNLSSTDRELRGKSVGYAVELMKIAAEAGTAIVGLPSGDDPGDLKREEAKKALFDSYCRISEAAKEYDGLHLTLEPLDRYVHKKQLMGPIHEVAEWFGVLKKTCPNFYLHWDSAHEALAGIGLMESLEAALPYMAQFHICNCVTEPSHPYYGDFHMEVGRAPHYKNWGYLTPEIAAGLLKRAAEGNPAEGITNTHVAVEVRSHMGDALWERERDIRGFLMRAFDLAGISY